MGVFHALDAPNVFHYEHGDLRASLLARQHVHHVTVFLQRTHHLKSEAFGFLRVPAPIVAVERREGVEARHLEEGIDLFLVHVGRGVHDLLPLHRHFLARAVHIALHGHLHLAVAREVVDERPHAGHLHRDFHEEARRAGEGIEQQLHVLAAHAAAHGGVVFQGACVLFGALGHEAQDVECRVFAVGRHHHRRHRRDEH